jgi:hypothetical protein
MAVQQRMELQHKGLVEHQVRAVTFDQRSGAIVGSGDRFSDAGYAGMARRASIEIMGAPREPRLLLGSEACIAIGLRRTGGGKNDAVSLPSEPARDSQHRMPVAYGASSDKEKTEGTVEPRPCTIHVFVLRPRAVECKAANSKVSGLAQMLHDQTRGSPSTMACFSQQQL